MTEIKINQPLLKLSAICVYKDGTRTLDSLKEGYEEPVKQHVGETYPLNIIDNALVKGFISEEEYRQTMVYTSQTQSAD